MDCLKRPNEPSVGSLQAGPFAKPWTHVVEIGPGTDESVVRHDPIHDGRSYWYEGYAQAAGLEYWPVVTQYYRHMLYPVIVDFCAVLKVLDFIAGMAPRERTDCRPKHPNMGCLGLSHVRHW